jgi:hypothetical protein
VTPYWGEGVIIGPEWWEQIIVGAIEIAVVVGLMLACIWVFDKIIER